MGDVIVLDGGLFAEPPRVPRPPVPHDPRSRAQRRRDLQAAAIDLGQHPLSVALRVSIPLHDDVRAAAMAGDAGAGPTCRGCALRRSVSGGNKSFPKCTAQPVERSRVDEHGKTWRWNEYPRATHGEGTDVRGWWPACANYEPRETRS